jgi:hypothetical protein
MRDKIMDVRDRGGPRRGAAVAVSLAALALFVTAVAGLTWTATALPAM